MTRRFKPDRLIVNKPYEEPSSYWRYVREDRMFELVEGERRPAGYVRATPGSTSFDDPGIFVELPLVNQIRPRVRAWREAGYPGVTGITKRLLEHWRDPEERKDRRFFFCQLEAIETLIWLTEGSAAERQGIVVPGDGGPFQRLCAKMATGSGKTIVIAMTIAWQVLNKVTYPPDTRFSKHVLVIAPGLTVRNRLKVVELDAAEDYYDEFNIVPAGLVEKLRLGKVRVRNWHVLNWDTEKKLAKRKRVDKRGAKSDEAYTRDVLGKMAAARNILVINDEAHHAWRVPQGSTVGVNRTVVEEATKWVGGLDRIHRSRGILTCFDFTATPFVPLGRTASDESLFDWIISDFGLNDAIEAGLVKTPRVVVRDDAPPDARTFKSRLYHIYMDPEVRDDLNRQAEEQEPLPDLVNNAYALLGADWLEHRKSWLALGHTLPPVMITVANRTETAARIRYAFERKRIRVEELTDPDRILHIDSKVLEFAESQEEADETDVDGPDDADEIEADDSEPIAAKLTKKQKAEQLRQIVRTVGQVGKPGEQIQKVISVGMLSEGWDAKTVTHIMGLRAFTSQLLCEQVVGRGLRRKSYDVDPETGYFQPEYVNIFGVPFTFMPHEDAGDGPPPPPPPPKTCIQPVPERAEFAISWPNVVRVEHHYRPMLTLDLAKVEVLQINASELRTIADLAPVVDGKPDVTQITEINLQELAKRSRWQTLIFQEARDVYDQMNPNWSGQRESLLAQLVGIAERFLRSDRIEIVPPLFNQDDARRRLAIALSATKIVQHLWDWIRQGNADSLSLVFDRDHPIRGTHDMKPWYTSKPCELAPRCHISHCVYDGTWESCEEFEIQRNPAVSAWVKNDHLGFEIIYVYNGVVHKYRPDFLIRLTNGTTLVLEVKGQETQKDRTKRAFLDEWVRAVNAHGGFGRWASDVSHEPREVAGIIDKHSSRTPMNPSE